MRRLLCGLALTFIPFQVMALSQYTPAAVNGTMHLTTPATLSDQQSSVFLSDTTGNLNVNIANATVPSLPVIVTITQPLYRPVPADCVLTVSGATAISLTSCSGGVPATANFAEVCSVGSTVMYSQTTTPTTTTGQYLAGGTATPPSVPVCKTFGPSPNGALTGTQFIEQTGTGTATLHILFYNYN